MKKFLMVMGVLFLLLIFGKLFVLADDDGERLIDPDKIKAPHVQVSR